MYSVKDFGIFKFHLHKVAVQSDSLVVSLVPDVEPQAPVNHSLLVLDEDLQGPRNVYHSSHAQPPISWRIQAGGKYPRQGIISTQLEDLHLSGSDSDAKNERKSRSSYLLRIFLPDADTLETESRCDG